MNHVERFRAVMNFEPVDRLPRWEWAMWWDETIARWKGEGLPGDLDDVFEISTYFGLDPYKQFWFSTTEATIDAKQHHVEGVVSSMDDYLRVLPRLYPDHSRAIEAMAPWANEQARGEAVVWITLEGFFWFPRTLMGFVDLMYAFVEQPELIHRINEDLLRFNLDLLDRIRRVCVPTFMTVAEDLDVLTIVDTDGDVTKLVPWLQGVGVEGVLPLERQAGVDGMRLREQFPRFALVGHYNKMVMPHGEAAMREEFERLVPLMRRGGFIPSVDHQTPPGVSLDQYRVYRRVLDEFTA